MIGNKEAGKSKSKKYCIFHLQKMHEVGTVFEQVIFVHMREKDEIYFLLKKSMYYLTVSLGYRLTPGVNKGRCTSCLRIAANNVNGAMFFVFIHQLNDGRGCERWCFLCHHPLHTPTNSCYSLRTTVLRQIFVHCDTFSSTFAAFPRPSCYIDNITK